MIQKMIFEISKGSQSCHEEIIISNFCKQNTRKEVKGDRGVVTVIIFFVPIYNMPLYALSVSVHEV